jgi:Holliday junction resolvase RusA-like endonuclease
MAGSPTIAEQIAQAPAIRTLDDLIREQYPNLDKKPPCVVRSGKRIIVTIYRRAVPAPRMTRADRWKKRPCVLQYRAWRDEVRAAFGDIPAPETVETISIRCYFVPPKSWKKNRFHGAMGQRHRQMPDSDNITKGIKDALWERDEKVGGERCDKWWDYEERVVIEIELA